MLYKQNKKFYIVDPGIRRYLLSHRKYDLGFSIENVVFRALLRRGHRVNIGKVGQDEVDFVVTGGDTKHYYQVTASLTDENTFAREIAPLKAVSDNHPKMILTLDRFTTGDHDEICFFMLSSLLFQNPMLQWKNESIRRSSREKDLQHIGTVIDCGFGGLLRYRSPCSQ